MANEFPTNAIIIDELLGVIYKYTNKISVPEAVGLLELAKFTLIEGQRGIQDVDQSP